MAYLGLSYEKQVGDYVLNELMIEGALCQIYHGTHIPTGEKVAIKVFNKLKLNSEKNNMVKVEKEISIFKKMFHKNIIKLYEIMETTQRIYLVMEYCDGGDLYNYILTKGHLSERQSCKFFHEIIETLSYLHSMQIAHRDIKPENFLLDTSGKSISLKLIDFGISNNYNGNLLNTSCGTSAFAAPEMYKGEKYNGLLCDIWSAGIVLYAMVFGYLPFSDENEQRNINNIIKGNYEIPEEANDDLRELLSHIIEINPDKRYNLEQIKNHKWYNIVNNNPIPGIDIDKYKIPIDERIINVCQAYGYDKEKINESVSGNFYDNNTSIYYIIVAKFIRERYDSISDLFSQDYLDYINDTKNLINNISNNDNKNKIIKDNINDEENNNEIKNNENNNNENEDNINKENNKINSSYNKERDEDQSEENKDLYSDKKDTLNDKDEPILLEDKNNNNIDNKNNNNSKNSEQIEKDNKEDNLKINEIQNKNEKVGEIEINNNELSDSSENFQLYQFSESEQNNNLRNSDIPNNDNKKNEILSYSFTETSPKGNTEINDNNDNNSSKVKEQNKSLINKIDNNIKMEKNNDKNQNEKLKNLNEKMEITNISIFIQCESKTKKNDIKENTNENKKNTIIKKKQNLKNKNFITGDKTSIKNHLNKKSENNIRNNKEITKKNNIIYNRNNLLNNGKRNYNTELKNKSNTNIKSKNARNNLHKGTQKYSLNNNILNRNKSSSQKIRNNISNKIENNKDNNKECKHLRTVTFSKDKLKNKINKHNKMNNHSIDISNKNYNKFQNKDNKSSYYTNYEINNYNSIKSSYNKAINKNSVLKSISNQKNQNYKKFYSSKKENSPISKQLNFNKMFLNSNENRSFCKNNLNKMILKMKFKRKYDNNKSFDFNINKEKKKNLLKKINKDLIKTNYHPNKYKGPIDLNRLIITSNIDEVYKELINTLNRNKIFFKREKSNKCRLYCSKEEFSFEIEIFNVYDKELEDEKFPNINLFYFTYILKASNKNTLKYYIDLLNNSIFEKFSFKNYIDNACK